MSPLTPLSPNQDPTGKFRIDSSSVDEAIVTMSRVVKAPRDVVWTAFTEPKHVVHWYGGHGFTNPVCEMDVRAGGTWHHVMRTPDGIDYTLDFVFLEVKKPEKLVWQSKDHGKRLPGRPPTCVMTVTFEEVPLRGLRDVAGGQTKLTIVSRFDSLAERDAAMQMGFTTMITQGAEKLDELVKRL